MLPYLMCNESIQNLIIVKSVLKLNIIENSTFFTDKTKTYIFVHMKRITGE